MFMKNQLTGILSILPISPQFRMKLKGVESGSTSKNLVLLSVIGNATHTVRKLKL